MNKKTMAVLLLIMGSVALGVVQAQQQAATMTAIAQDSHSVTIKVNAGAHVNNGQVVGLPYGFLINWSSNGSSHNVFYDGSACPEFSLPPNGSTIVTVDGVTGSSCIINESPQALPVGFPIRFVGEPVGIPGKIKGFAVVLSP